MPTAQHRRGEASEILEHLRSHASIYGAGHKGGVTLLSQELRPSSRIYRFRVVAGQSDDRTLIVKVAPPTEPEEPAAGDDTGRPRITSRVDRRAAVRLEYEALSRIHSYFSALNDPRFGAVRVFGMLTQPRGIVMEAVNHPSLREQAFRVGRWPTPRRSRAVLAAFEHAGAWLHEYHALPGTDAMATLRMRRDDSVGFVAELAGFLRGRLPPRAQPFLARVVDTSRTLAETVLPRVLPAGVGHGDFAMRNIVVGPLQQVTVLDTLARYRTAIYRDIGYFLADLQTSTLAALREGALLHGYRCATYRQAFLEGYFGGPHWPDEAVRLYEVQALLERWSAVMERRREGVELAGLTRLQRVLLSRYFMKEVAARLRIDG